MKTKTKSARLNMKIKTNTLLGAVLFLLVIGASATIANAQDGTLVSWGDTSSGQRSGMPLGTFTTVDAYYLTSVAIRTDGTLVSWGSNHSGQVSGTPAGMFPPGLRARPQRGDPHGWNPGFLGT